MGKRSTWFGIAVSMTALDAAVTKFYGGVLWKAFAAVIWSKLLLFLLAAVWAIKLLHVWVRAYSHLRQAIQDHRVVVSIPVSRISAELAEETDV